MQPLKPQLWQSDISTYIQNHQLPTCENMHASNIWTNQSKLSTHVRVEDCDFSWPDEIKHILGNYLYNPNLSEYQTSLVEDDNRLVNSVVRCLEHRPVCLTATIQRLTTTSLYPYVALVTMHLCCRLKSSHATWHVLLHLNFGQE